MYRSAEDVKEDISRLGKLLQEVEVELDGLQKELKGMRLKDSAESVGAAADLVHSGNEFLEDAIWALDGDADDGEDVLD